MSDPTQPVPQTAIVNQEAVAAAPAPVAAAVEATAPVADEPVTETPSPLQVAFDNLKADYEALKTKAEADLAGAKSDVEALKTAFTAHLVDFNSLANTVNGLVADGKAFVKKEEGFFHKIGHELEDGAASLVARVKSWFSSNTAAAPAPATDDSASLAAAVDAAATTDTANTQSPAAPAAQ